jgi:sulfoxide reductase heme-binding subunit YedZ
MDQVTTAQVPASISTPPTQPTPTIASVGQDLKQKRRRNLILFSLGTLLFWLVEYLAQVYVYSPLDSSGAWVRSFSFTGLTLISLALFSSTIFKWFPQTAKLWRWRRWLGVAGFFFITLHIFTVVWLFFKFDLTYLYFSWNPWVNLIIPGTLAYIILLVMAITSTDTMVSKIKPKKWKFIHRFVYLAFIAAMLHFLFVHPVAIKNIPGYFLMAVTFITIISQLYWFFRIAGRKRFMTRGALVGFGLIALAIISFWLTNRAQQ